MRDRFRAGDPAALGEAYDEHARVLYHYAFRVCGDRAAAEDVVSATFLEAWRCRGKVHADGGTLRPWLLGIATNIMRGAAREARRRDAALARLPERGVLPDFADEVLARMTDGEQVRAARAALAKLRRREREVFTLVVWAGLDYAAAGEALGIPVGTVRSRLSRARERLRKLADAELRTLRRHQRSAVARGGGPAERPAGRSAVRSAVQHAVPSGVQSAVQPAVQYPAQSAVQPAVHPTVQSAAQPTVRPALVPRTTPETQA
ncbi:RNA polymerase sigma factor [Streptomyces sp. WAC01280]|uniref:RNA polymerase sigma factor n=1 Tax=Streptomyces sp. WAC01280 TaxID=2487424 RepID=UPI00163BD417|nr:RNA polymerase sigma factor [Streptomyces sp. WAC01280]